MRIDEGREELTSKMGACCSIVFIVLMLAYASYKISILEGKKSVDIVQATKENYFDDNYVFGAEQGLNIAFGVFNPANPTKLDPTYGEIIFSMRSWYYDDDG